MESLDVPTILKVSAVFNVMAALAWLTLAQAFRIAPRASRLMAAAHVVRFATQGYGDALAGWPDLLRQAIPEFGRLASIVLLLALLAVREVVRGVGDQLSPVIKAGMTLPFALLAAMSLTHGTELLLDPVWHEHVLRGELPSATSSASTPPTSTPPADAALVVQPLAWQGLLPPLSASFGVALPVAACACWSTSRRCAGWSRTGR